VSDHEFNKLVNGPLSHPLVLFRLTRLSTALRAVVEATGAAGEKALRDHCARREEQDAPREQEFAE
jgi:hypothetical protein